MCCLMWAFQQELNRNGCSRVCTHRTGFDKGDKSWKKHSLFHRKTGTNDQPDTRLKLPLIPRFSPKNHPFLDTFLLLLLVRSDCCLYLLLVWRYFCACRPQNTHSQEPPPAPGPPDTAALFGMP
ncbi:hypothetical protein XENOCAPTIV_005757 [Xenoophorus captivus]|uniref:Uncharacterized protein n=1 Tax=Xenoophorus captivus TaxID=1517983 RepID=A0ABV0RTL8_9TELE